MRNVLIGLTLFVLSPLAMAAPLQFGQGPIQASTTKAAQPGAPEGTPVSVDMGALAAAEADGQTWLPGRDGQAVPARVVKVTAREDGAIDWSARVLTDSGEQTATIVIRQGHAFGWIPQPKGEALRLETRHGQSRIVQEKSWLRPEGPDVLLPPDPSADQRALRKRQESGKAEGTPRIDVLVAYQNSDAEQAVQVRARDAELDAHYTALFRELLTYMMEDPRNITPCTHLLFMAKNLERIGDHATNIAENVWFLVHGDQPLPPRDKRDETSTTGAV